MLGVAHTPAPRRARHGHLGHLGTFITLDPRRTRVKSIVFFYSFGPIPSPGMQLGPDFPPYAVIVVRIRGALCRSQKESRLWVSNLVCARQIARNVRETGD